MKNYKWIVSALVGLLLSSTGFAESGHSGEATIENTDVKKELFLDLKEEAKKCVVEIVRTTKSEKEIMGYESTCPTFKIASSTQAQVYIDGQWYNAITKESDISDDGDIDNLYITDANGKLVAQKLNIAAYDSVISAIVGSEPSLKQREQP
ncbi:MAG: hypothetical protein H7256_06630 [Bdellovibrio sp.]|nr:hypothetical protein [Bdellovibrio sp.]